MVYGIVLPTLFMTGGQYNMLYSIVDEYDHHNNLRKLGYKALSLFFYWKILK